MNLDPAALSPFVRFGLTLFGAAAMYVFSLHKGFEGATPFLKRVLPGRSPVFYSRVDALAVTVVGGIIGFVFFAPASNFEALAAGFGWLGAVNVMLSQGRGVQP